MTTPPNPDPNMPQYQPSQPGVGVPPGQYAPPPGYNPYGPPANPEKNGFGLAAVILGVVGLLFCLIPITGFIGFICGVMALVFGLAGFGRVRKNKATNKKTAISGIVLGILAIAGGIAGIVIVFTAVDQLGDDLSDVGNDLDSYSACISAADTPEEISACN